MTRAPAATGLGLGLGLATATGDATAGEDAGLAAASVGLAGAAVGAGAAAGVQAIRNIPIPMARAPHLKRGNCINMVLLHELVIELPIGPPWTNARRKIHATPAARSDCRATPSNRRILCTSSIARLHAAIHAALQAADTAIIGTADRLRRVS